ncbi:hypothetical protein HJFPF1_11927 [Paramyrothecium foliicola]|nr:hypothetical protein HJFPF1_11927 [Paramyrothecium foliicola]
MAPSTIPTILLVQGSFQYPEVYEKLITALKLRDFDVFHPKLPSLTGQDEPEFSTKSLLDDAQAIESELRKLVEEQKRLTQTQANNMEGGVFHLFYIAGFVLSVGQSVLGVFGESPNNLVYPDGKFSLKNAAKTIYHDLPFEESQYWESRIICQSSMVQTTKLTRVAYDYISSTYLVCEDDQAVPPQFQETFAKTAKAISTLRISTGHSPWFTKSEELADMIMIFVYQLILTGLASAQYTYAKNEEILEKDPEHVAANFPDVDVELRSPAFLNPESAAQGFTNGTAGATNQRTMEYFLQNLASKNDWMTYHVPAFASEEGRSIPYVVLSTTPVPSRPNFKNDTQSSEKSRIWIHGGVHGNEPGGDQALLALLGKLDADPAWATAILEKLDILIVPRYNADGVAYFQRYLASSYDPNRDHTKLYSQQTRDIKRLNREFNAHISIDCHEYTASRKYGGDAEYLPMQDVQFSSFKNPNVHHKIRELAESLFLDNVQEALISRNMTTSPYVVFPDPAKLQLTEFVTDAKGDTAVSLGQGLAFLTETRGIRLGDQHFRRRTVGGLVAVEAVIQTAADNAALVYRTVEQGRDDFIHNNQEIIVTDYPRWTNKTWSFIEAATGQIVQVPVMFGNNTPPTSNLTRSRPEAYVFSRAWVSVAELLRTTSVEVQELQSDFRGEVEAFTAKTAVVELTKYEGTARTTVTTESSKKIVEIPAGGYWVSTRQQNAAHAFVRLEPENIDSFVSFNILPLLTGDEYQVYRVL